MLEVAVELHQKFGRLKKIILRYYDADIEDYRSKFALFTTIQSNIKSIIITGEHEYSVI